MGYALLVVEDGVQSCTFRLTNAHCSSLTCVVLSCYFVIFVTSGVHDDEDPEYSILKQRMVNKMREEGTVVDESFNLTDITKIAERTITAVSHPHST